MRLRGGIIAAGDGQRLRDSGFTMPKPLVPVAGVPLIEAVVRGFEAAGIESLVIIVNERAAECVEFVRRRFRRLDVDFIVKTTASSLESFRLVIERAAADRVLVSTVDAWCPRPEFVRFAAAAAARPADATVLGVTPFVADERPLWVRIGGDGRVVEIGGAAGDAVTAGYYLVPERVRRLTPPPDLGRLRDFLRWIAERGEPLFAERIPRVVDVDRASDVALAEAEAGAAPA